MLPQPSMIRDAVLVDFVVSLAEHHRLGDVAQSRIEGAVELVVVLDGAQHPVLTAKHASPADSGAARLTWRRYQTW